MSTTPRRQFTKRTPVAKPALYPACETRAQLLKCGLLIPGCIICSHPRAKHGADGCIAGDCRCESYEAP